MLFLFRYSAKACQHGFTSATRGLRSDPAILSAQHNWMKARERHIYNQFPVCRKSYELVPSFGSSVDNHAKSYLLRTHTRSFSRFCQENNSTYFEVPSGRIVTIAGTVSPRSVSAVALTIMVGSLGTVSGAVYVPVAEMLPQASAEQAPTILQVIGNCVLSVVFSVFPVGTSRSYTSLFLCFQTVEIAHPHAYSP